MKRQIYFIARFNPTEEPEPAAASNNWRPRPETTILEYFDKDDVANDTEIFLNSFETLGQLADFICKEIFRLEDKRENFEFFLQCDDGRLMSLDKHMTRQLHDLDVDFSRSFGMEVVERVPTEDDLVLGASASPTTDKAPSSSEETGPEVEEPRTYGPFPNYEDDNNCDPNNAQASSSTEEPLKYVGLVNQAMTCYLNSLVQSLFMTPEFRNAIYNWEFDGQSETRSIPYQLQKLFLNLQTSNRSAVETTDLTTSFGWQGSEAWHQHDIQELCRVMFDALERKFKDTKQADFINDLYEGKMLDYVKCLECGTEKSREDTFLDIPLPVRPFGSAVAYNSVEEALRAFVQPETLDGNNQYHCDKCDKKCDAHKGLKFIKFPYLLTLHLKRFDFDYNTMHRIKLNDKVVFSDKLNLNSFVPKASNKTDDVVEEGVVKCDDCSTTDSGSALDDESSCQGTDVSSAVNHLDNCEDIDEGIDVSSGNAHNDIEAKGPYNYELFSIMIHSGSASGGHYYAFIKDLDKNNWLCFNDQIVSRITEEDLKKTYGGGPQKGYYSGAYSSSTNAYMLMYRQIDAKRNAAAMTVEEFPKHIKHLFQLIKEKEKHDLINKEKQIQSMKLMIYCTHPITEDLMDIRMTVFPDTTLREGAVTAHRRFKLEDFAKIDDCRLVVYDRIRKCILFSYDDLDSEFKDLNEGSQTAGYKHWYLEIKNSTSEFVAYSKDGFNCTVYHILNVESEDVGEPFTLRIDKSDDLEAIKKKLEPFVDLDASDISLCVQEYEVAFNREPKFCEDSLEFDVPTSSYKLFVASKLDVDGNRSKLFDVIKKLENIVHIRIFVPDTDPNTMEKLAIPSYDDKLDHRGSCSPQPGVMAVDAFGDQSNSEDSSLSDSDRTLVADILDEVEGMPSKAISPSSDPSFAETSDPTQDIYNYDVLGNPSEEKMSWDGSGDDKKMVAAGSATYFRVTSLKTCRKEVSDLTYTRCYKILVDNRMTLETFKKLLEPVVRVPKEYFKVCRQYWSVEEDWSNQLESFGQMNNNDHAFAVKLGRVLSSHEQFCNVYLLKCDNLADPVKFLFEHFLTKGQTVGSLKKEILSRAKRQHSLDIPFNRARLREKCGKGPRHVYLNHQTFDTDICVYSNFELYLQELQEPETVMSETEIVLFARHWCPSTLTLQPFQEVVLKTSLLSDLKERVAELSEIPVDCVEVAFTRHFFPADKMHLLDIHTELEWNPNVTHLEHWPLHTDDGSVFFYRDKREKLKELTPEEKAEISSKEDVRLGRNQTRSCVSSERSLRILSDNWPSDVEDGPVVW